MDERVLRFRVGVVVVAAALITGILIAVLGAWPNPFKPRYTLSIRFPEAPGVTVDTPVRKNGIQIGRVSAVELVDKGVLLTIKIDAEYQLRKSEICEIGTGSLITGDSILEFVQTDDPSTDWRQDKDYSTDGRVQTDPFQSLANVDVASTITSIKEAGDEVKKLAGTMNAILDNNGQTVTGLVGNLEEGLANFNATMTEIRTVLGAIGDKTNQDNLRKSLEAMPQMATAAQGTLAEMNATLKKFKEVATQAQIILVNISQLADAMRGEDGQQVVQKIVGTLDNFQQLTSNLVELSESINSQDGTVGLLIHDRELYDRVNRTVAEFERATQKIHPIIADARIFMDKMARDPGKSEFAVY